MRKCWEGSKKTCWSVGRGVGKCWGKERGKCVRVWGRCGEALGEVWESVLGRGGSGKVLEGV